MNLEPASAPRWGGAIVFWMLISLGAIVFVPCLLLPEWRNYETMRYAEQWERHRLAAMEWSVAEQRRALDALQSDPGVIARVARRELGYLRPDEREVEVGPVSGSLPPTPTSAPDFPFDPATVEPPRLLGGVIGLMPDFDYDALFCEPRMRGVLMTMSLALIMSACVLFRHTPRELEETGG